MLDTLTDLAAATLLGCLVPIIAGLLVVLTGRMNKDAS